MKARLGVALLVVLWAAATVPAVTTAVRIVSERAAADRMTPLIGRAVLALEAERRLSVAARPGQSAPPAGFADQRSRTDQAGETLRGAADGWASRTRATDETRAADALVRRMTGLPALRAAVDDGQMPRRTALDAYTAIIGSPLGDSALTRTRELLSEEDALLAATAGVARVTDADRLRLAELAGARRTLLVTAAVTPPAADRLRSMEDALILKPGPVPDGWSAAFNTANTALWDGRTDAAREARDETTPSAVAAIAWACLVGAVGLIAVVAVLMYPRRSTRRVPAPATVPAAAGEQVAAPQAGPGLDALLRDLERRNQSLVHRLLRLLDGLARHESDDETLGELFRADHFANRIRRNLEKAIMLAGDLPGRRWNRPVPLADVVRAAASEVPEFERVSTSRIAPVHLTGAAVTGTMHLLAELIENATTFAPAQTRVRVTGEPAPVGYEVTVADVGPGMTDDDLATAYAVLSDPSPRPGGTWWGLYATGRFAERLGIEVRLRNAPGGGLEASVIIPAALLVDAEAAEAVPDDATGEMPAIAGGVGRS
ncbi:sensor histidine kinase [Actinoplanes friuliensis]|uniref:histidine kinase n=1 Tax=Actinoplanes friuliensis DSM 7358 TaxID=1246995 RepID=U5VUW5_9ACTN|nr:nitrate- and nitrite sensing domain-containing protein [Actinoplanes friuliensis]AGZ40783.1 ATP-binding region ATPase domain-containing protein [Actinoplanes friuliensis DSM 7358]